MTLNEYVIETHGLSKSYDGVQALNNLDLQVQPNSIFGFLGPNGAGKTTTMKLLLGLIRPTAGAGKVFGMDILRDSVDIRRRVGYLPQDPRFYNHMTIWETLDFTIRFYFKGPQAAIKDRIRGTLELVDLADKADRKVKNLSGGERQRLGIAQAQVNYPDLLILDEPAASLDPLGRHAVLQVMERLRKHTTVFYSTHILDDVQAVSDTVAILNQGELVAHGPIETLLTSSTGTVFSVSVLNGSAENCNRVAAQDWVVNLEVVPRKEGETWLVSVSDETIARDQLLRLIMEDRDLVVLEYGRKRFELEEVFINIVQGGGNDRE
jgi:ABC-2 type transport system ATP-binding protein